jgi:hypothetical protein
MAEGIRGCRTRRFDGMLRSDVSIGLGGAMWEGCFIRH